MAGVIVATRPIRAEVAAVAAGADASVPLIVLEGRAGCDASLDLPLPTQAPGAQARRARPHPHPRDDQDIGRAQGRHVHPADDGLVRPAPCLEYGAGPWRHVVAAPRGCGGRRF